jgi:DNA-binding NarL/FixJ family response regulator
MKTLSNIEISIIGALAEGLQSKEMACKLNKSRATIEFYIRLLYVKMDARSRAQLVSRAYELGLFSPGATLNGHRLA